MLSKDEQVKAMKARFKGKEFMFKGRMVFPKLLKPTADSSGRMKYSMLFFWKEDCPRNKPLVEEINRLYSEHKAEWYPKHPNLIHPIKHYDTYVKEDGSANATYLKGCYWINATAGEKFPPAVFDSNKNRVTSDAELTDGRECMVLFQIYPYSIPAGKTGVGMGMRAVILLPGGEVPYGNEPVDVDVLFDNDVQGEINKSIEQTADNTVAKDIPL